MKNQLGLLIGVILVIVLLVYMFAFQVRYDERAVVTTWDKAERPEYDKDGVIIPAQSGSVVVEPGLYFKWPWPIQNVHSYSTRLQILDSQQEQQITADGHSVIVRAYVAWRIEDPYAFFITLQNDATAQRRLRDLTQSLMTAVIGKYRFEDLVNRDPKLLKIKQVEDEALTQLRTRLAAIQPSYGIAVEELGIRKIVLPETVTQTVFASMRKTRERMAQDARTSGESAARATRDGAESVKRTILAFANRRAEAIRAQGAREASAAWGEFNEDTEFAKFMFTLDALKVALSKNTTFLLDAHGPLEPFRNEPGTTPDTRPTPVAPPGSAGPTAPQAEAR